MIRLNIVVEGQTEEAFVNEVLQEHLQRSGIYATSKRIIKHFRSYQKPFHGSLVAMDVGLDAMKARCSHFAKWLEKLERLKPIVP